MAENVLLTGATGGLGQALTKLYARPGNALALFGRDEAKLSLVQEACIGAGAVAETFPIDVRDESAMSEAILAFDQRHPTSIAIANAGISPASTAIFDKLLDVEAVNVRGTLNTILPVIAPMRMRRSGQIAIIGSLGARAAIAASPAYSMSKAAIETLGFGLRSVLAPDGISVSVVSPGFFASPMSARVRGPRLFKISADRAALLIQKGLQKNKARIAFPLPLALAATLLSALPYSIAESLTRPFAFEIEDHPNSGS